MRIATAPLDGYRAFSSGLTLGDSPSVTREGGWVWAFPRPWGDDAPPEAWTLTREEAAYMPGLGGIIPGQKIGDEWVLPALWWAPDFVDMEDQHAP